MKKSTPDFRFAVKDDCELILKFIKDLALYEHMENEVVATKELLLEWLFEKNGARVLFCMYEGKEVGFALFFRNFSTFLGRGGIYLEDLFVLPEYRGQGFGKAILIKLSEIAVSEGLGRLDWQCLNWNQKSLDFYLSLGAVKMEDWTTLRLTGSALSSLSEK